MHQNTQCFTTPQYDSCSVFFLDLECLNGYKEFLLYCFHPYNTSIPSMQYTYFMILLSRNNNLCSVILLQHRPARKLQCRVEFVV